uniref:Uncharacterized protein n=3 Tax=Octopus bimaculoides TaxID=37653 RepID=A0A0L8HE78_OCTBM
MSNFYFEHLIQAAQKGNLQYFIDYIDSFQEAWLIKKCNKAGDNIIHLIARFGRLNILKFISQELLNRHLEWTLNTKIVFESINNDRKTPLHEASQANQIECLQFLLSLSLNVDSMKKGDW